MSLLDMDLIEARTLQEGIERVMTRTVRNYEAKTGCVITKVELRYFEDVKFVTTIVALGRRTREERKADGSIPKQRSD